MLQEIQFPSFNERDTVYGWLYVPANAHKGIVQLVHGYGEHSRRYLHLIVCLMEAGYIVAADDHVGHGKTAVENNTWGDWGNKGFETMMEDEHILKEIVQKQFPDLPYFMFGHSMGSFITRQFTAKYGNELAGAVYCGTAGPNDALKAGVAALEALVAAGKGDEADPALGGALFASMTERFDNVKYGNEWVCGDPYVQIDHLQDPFNAITKPTNNRSLLYFQQMMLDIGSIEWAKKVPTSLPLYVIAGDQDPVGDYGKGVYTVVDWLWKTGHRPVSKLYPGYRHEIHNYPQIKNEVVAGIIEFFDAQLKK
ncbi:MAG: alpha/beta hydrolase [Solobacterium sp.]|nr:alpha/beta hydrolase [Solobacterium sp.]